MQKETLGLGIQLAKQKVNLAAQPSNYRQNMLIPQCQNSVILQNTLT